MKSVTSFSTRTIDWFPRLSEDATALSVMPKWTSTVLAASVRLRWKCLFYAEQGVDSPIQTCRRRAGPVGVVAALAAVQAGFDVTIFESALEVDHSPRAATTHPSTLEMIHRLGLLDRFLAEGLVARDFQFWDRESHSLVATFDHDVLRDDTPFPFAVQTEQHKLVHMGLDALRSLGCAIHFGTRVTSCVQNGRSCHVGY